MPRKNGPKDFCHCHTKRRHQPNQDFLWNDRRPVANQLVDKTLAANQKISIYPVVFIIFHYNLYMRNRDPHRENVESILAICLPIMTVQHVRESPSACHTMRKSAWNGRWHIKWMLGWAGVSEYFFWYNSDKDLLDVFYVTWLVSIKSTFPCRLGIDFIHSGVI